jgi:hypothetical protein
LPDMDADLMRQLARALEAAADFADSREDVLS